MPTDWNIEQLPEFLSPSAASDCLAPAPPIGLSGRSRASARSGPGTRAGPSWAGPHRDKPGHGVTVATPGDVTRGRDHRPPALPPSPLPNRVSLLGVRRCARAPTGVCQGPRALTQRSPRTGRFAATRVQPARRIGGEGLPSRLAWDAPKMRRSCALESNTASESGFVGAALRPKVCSQKFEKQDGLLAAMYLR